MLKIKLFNAKQPTNTQELEFFRETTQEEYLIGQTENCGIVLQSPNINEIQGCIKAQEGQYYFIPLTHPDQLRFNEEIVQNQQYLLDTDDIIRIQEFVLIVDNLSTTDKPKLEKKRITPSENGNSNKRSLDLLKSRLKKKDTFSPPPLTPSLPPLPPPLPTTQPQGNNTDLTVRCIGVIAETPDVKTFRFVAEPAVIFTYKPGQFITLKLTIDNKPVLRSYSISSTPSRPHVLEITVKRVPPPPDIPNAPPGLVSNWLHDHLKVGDTIQIKPPAGKFTCIDHSHQKLLLISAGSGITPMMSMSRWAYDTATEHDIVFFHSARSVEDVIYRQELDIMARRNPKFHLAISLTRTASDSTWQGLTGRLDEAMLQQVIPDYRERSVYVCGPNTFMQGVKSMLETIGFPMENYFEESFGSAKKEQKSKNKSDKLSLGSGSVIFKASAKEVSSNGEDAILDLAEQEGIEINSGCRSGSCGSCKVRKLEGEIQYHGEPGALDEAESQGYILTCIAYPDGKVTIDA